MQSIAGMATGTKKRAFDISAVLHRIRKEVAQYADAAMFELRDREFGSLFQQLVACIISVRTIEEFDGRLPAEAEVLKSFRGVGPKCANLALGVAEGQSRISVDVHVARVPTRWGYVKAGSAESVQAQLEEKLPQNYWIEINRLLVPFGKNVSTGVRPKCSTCSVLEYCRQVGVTDHR